MYLYVINTYIIHIQNQPPQIKRAAKLKHIPAINQKLLVIENKTRPILQQCYIHVPYLHT